MNVHARSLPPPSKKWCQPRRPFRVDCWAFHIPFLLALTGKTNVISKQSCLWKGKKFPHPFFCKGMQHGVGAPVQSQDHSEKCWHATLELDLTSFKVSASFSMYFNRTQKRSFHPLCLTSAVEIILVVKMIAGCCETYISLILTMGWQKLSVEVGHDNIELNLRLHSVCMYQC